MPKHAIRPFDIIMNLVTFVVIPVLSLWGGAKHWAGPADYLPFVLLPLGVVCITYFCIRFPLLRTGLLLGAGVPLCIILPSDLVYPDSDMDVLLLAGVPYGLLIVSITKAVKRTKCSRMVEAEPPLVEGEIRCLACNQTFVGTFDDQGRCPLCGEMGR